MMTHAFTAKLCILLNGVAREPGTELDLCVYRSNPESLYGGPLLDVGRRLPSWTDTVSVHQEDFMLCSRVLPPDLRTPKKTTLTFWSNIVHEVVASSSCSGIKPRMRFSLLMT